MQIRLLVFLGIAAIATNASAAPVIFNGYSYDLTPAGSWTSAESFAVSQGGHLVTIDDAAENEFLRTTFLNITGSQEDFWIGLYAPAGAVTDPANYEWVSGSTSTYRNWRSPGQPDAGSGHAYTAINFLQNDDGTWDNYPDTGFRTIRGIFEVNAVPEPSAFLSLAFIGLLVCGKRWAKRRFLVSEAK
jgi:hypothetical protein